MFLVRIVAKCLKGGQNNKDGGPSVVERERQMHKEFVCGVLDFVELLDDVIDVCYGRRDEKGEDKG